MEKGEHVKKTSCTSSKAQSGRAFLAHKTDAALLSPLARRAGAALLSLVVLLAFVPLTGMTFAIKSDTTAELSPLAGLVWNSNSPPVVAHNDTVTISGTPSGTLVVPAAATVTIDGDITGVTTGITLNIGTGATVRWNVNFQSVSSSYHINVSGSGTLEITSGTIINSGQGGAIQVSGAGTTITIGNDASVFSGTSGNAILVSAANVTINVNPGGIVESLDGNGNAAIQIGSGSNNNIQGTVINVNGGSVISEGAGYAINDSAGSGTVTNNTQITVNSGTVSAGVACAILSRGTASVVTVNGGTLSNSAGNLNPVIYMNGGTGDNILINGGTVQTLATGGYALQTTGRVTVSGGLVTAVNGRAINLVGLNSLATVSGGTVQTTGTGTAISTATTDLPSVRNASVRVTGGTVSSTNGLVINITGEDSTVVIEGGVVSSLATSSTASSPRHTINASGTDSKITVLGGVVSSIASNAINTSGTNSTVVVDGGNVRATGSGNAINASGTNAVVTIKNTLNVIGGSQVSATTGLAVNVPSGVLTTPIAGGFLFAYGNSIANVISASNVTGSPSLAGSSAMVVSWDTTTGRAIYQQNLTTAMTRWSGSGTYIWFNSTSAHSGGISYSNDATSTGFFAISGVTIVQDYGLIFDATSGFMYTNLTGSGIPGGSNYQFDTFSMRPWSGKPGELTLKGFSWNTTEPIALTIYGGDVTIILEDGTTNTFTSAGPQSGNSFGIFSFSNENITITGGGTLIAGGSPDIPTGNYSYGIHPSAGELSIISGSVIAKGGTAALSKEPGLLPTAYIWWKNTTVDPPAPMGAGTVCFNNPPGTTAFGTAYGYSLDDKYVKIADAAFAAIADVTVSGTAGTPFSTPFQTATITLYGIQTGASSLNMDASSWFANLPAGVVVTALAEPESSTITLSFDGTPAEGAAYPFDIVLPGSVLGSGDGPDLAVLFNPGAAFAIVSTYDLLVVADEGGSVSGTPSGRYIVGTPVSETATAASGFHFTGWTVSGVSISPGLSSDTTSFTMPAGRVVLTAGFERDVPLDNGNGLPQSGDTNGTVLLLLLLSSILGMMCIFAWRICHQLRRAW